MSSPKQAPLKVYGLRSENFKRLKAIELIGLDPHTVVVAGKNGNGKTSLIDVVFDTLASGKHTLSVDDPIRHGAERAVNELELMDSSGIPRFRVRKVYKPSGNELQIRQYLPDGELSAPLKSPQTVLDGFMSMISIDPMLFAKLDKEKRDALFLQVIGVRDKLDELKVKHDAAYESRRDAKAHHKTVMSRFSLLQEPDSMTPKERVDVTELQERRKIAQDRQQALFDKHHQVNNKRAEYKPLQDAQHADQEELERLQQRMQARQEKMDLIEQTAKQLAAELDDLPKPEDISVLDAQINNASDVNEQVRLAEEWDRAQSDLKSANKEIDKYQARLDTVAKEKLELITSAEYPIDGLSFDPENGLTFNGTAWQGMAENERVRVSTYMAMALQPTLHVLRVGSASLLDSASRAEIEAIAKEHDFQIFYELVDESGDVGVVIEDGTIKAGPQSTEGDAE